MRDTVKPDTVKPDLRNPGLPSDSLDCFNEYTSKGYYILINALQNKKEVKEVINILAHFREKIGKNPHLGALNLFWALLLPKLQIQFPDVAKNGALNTNLWKKSGDPRSDSCMPTWSSYMFASMLSTCLRGGEEANEEAEG